MITRTIYSILSADAELVAALGHTSSNPKIYAVAARQEVPTPMLVYTISDSEPEYNKNGMSEVGVDTWNVLVNVRHINCDNCWEIAYLVRNAMNKANGIYSNVVDWIRYRGMRDLPYEPQPRKEFTVELEFDIRERVQ